MITDVARFRPDDPDALVSAALACPLCLHSEEVHFTAALEGYDPRVDCVCPSCLERWQVYLNPQQALRFGLLTARANG
jgi:hypothetical protein